MFKDDAGRERERPLTGVARSQEVGEDQHAFGMDGPAQFHLALDVDHLALAQSRARRDAAGVAKHGLPHLDHRQAVHLAHGFTLRVDQDCSPADFFLQPLPQPAGPVDLCLDGSFNVSRLNHVPFGIARPVIGFLQQITQSPVMRGELFRIAGDAGALFDHSRHGRARKCEELVPACHGSNQLCVEQVVLCRAVHLFLKVDGDLEQIVELRIVMAEKIEQQPLANENHFEL